MERKIGETFEFEGKTLQVKESSSSGCDGCFFDEQHIPCSKNVAGYCDFKFRADKKNVIFVEVQEQPQEEQPQEEQPQKLNLCEILKDCPEGITDWVDTDEINLEYEGQKIKHRIKPEVKYRPFKTQEECWGEILKHECCGWMKSKDNNDRRHISSIQKDDEDNAWFIIVSFGGIEGFSSEQMFENFEFLDDTPFGVKEG